MKRVEFVIAATLLLPLGTYIPAATRRNRKTIPSPLSRKSQAAGQRIHRAKPPQREAPRPEPGRQENTPQPEKADREPAKHASEESKKAQEQDKKVEEQQRRAQEEQARTPHEQPRQAQRPEQPSRTPVAGRNRGERIPDDRFREHFGRQHTFVINRPVIIDNRPRFQYSGYWFEIVDPWPPQWAYSDDCYIDYVDDGYYLFNPYHPGIRIAVMVVAY